MILTKFQNKISLLLRVIRFNNPTGFILLLLPCLMGLALTKQPINWYVTFYFIFGSFIMRSAGCIINDIIDLEFDKYVERTKSRPLAAGELSVLQACVILCFLLVIALILFYNLNLIGKYISVIGLCLTILYPLMKRITYLPQIFLGIVFNLGAIIAYTQVTDQVDCNIIMLYIGCISWTVAYDSIYAFQDFHDDSKIGVKSLTFVLNKNFPKVWLIFFYFIFLTSLMLIGDFNHFGIFYFLIISVVYAIIFNQIYVIDLENKQECARFFNFNIIVGILILIALILA